jgi:hypothetical protein
MPRRSPKVPAVPAFHTGSEKKQTPAAQNTPEQDAAEAAVRRIVEAAYT